MTELQGISLLTHLESLEAEWHSSKSLYQYPQRKIFLGAPGFDFSVGFHDKRAFTPLGPASGPHTQLAQNIVLSFLGGGRIMELKTVQILDELQIPRPCIDARNICFNVEWSQELKLPKSYEEYVKAWILLKFLEHEEWLGIPKGDPFYSTVFDLSVGYDLKGISSPQMQAWIEGMLNAEKEIARQLEALPEKWRQRIPRIDPKIGNSITLSTFHGCPPKEIEAIVQHLIAEHKVHVIVKMNPTQLGFARVSELLHESLGYKHIELDPKAFEHDMQFDDAIAMMQRLQKFAQNHGKNVGAKFTNTLVVKNTQKIFKGEAMYLSGEPLHVLAMHAMHNFREKMGADFPISFSAGVSKENVVEAIACNMQPVSVCTDLLRKGGYTRMREYLTRLQQALLQAQVTTLKDFICHQGAAKDLAQAGINYCARYVQTLAQNPHYHYAQNAKEPKRVDSRLKLFDCLSCDICIPVCPNAANFSYSFSAATHQVGDLVWNGTQFVADAEQSIEFKKDTQIGNIVEFCNQCGNCDTFCPEEGGPYVEKPRFYLFEENFNADQSDGVWLKSASEIRARFHGELYSLKLVGGDFHYSTPLVGLMLNAQGQPKTVEPQGELNKDSRISMRYFVYLKALCQALGTAGNAYPRMLLKGTNHSAPEAL